MYWNLINNKELTPSYRKRNYILTADLSIRIDPSSGKYHVLTRTLKNKNIAEIIAGIATTILRWEHVSKILKKSSFIKEKDEIMKIPGVRDKFRYVP